MFNIRNKPLVLVFELRSPDPVMPLHLLAIQTLRTGVTVITLFAATLGPLLYFETVYFQDVHGYNALQTGLAYLNGVTGDARRTATTDGLRTAVLISAAGVLLTAALALTGRRRTATVATPAPVN
jgi:hypothetical protein